jgi:uncharacterized protein involved in exopolysaccharide biosynthesis/Mrp family chromosome partitioning ATPase
MTEELPSQEQATPSTGIKLRNTSPDAIAQSIDFDKILHGIKSRRWFIIMCAICMMSLGGIAFLLIPKNYEAESLLLYQQDFPRTLGGGYVLNRLSYSTASDIVLLPTNFKSVKTILGLALDESEIEAMVNVESAKKTSYLVRITASSKDPQLALNVSNTLAKVVAKRSSDYNQAQLKEAYQYFLRDLDAQKKQLDAATFDLAQFRIDNECNGEDTEGLPVFAKLAGLEKRMEETNLEYNGLAVRYENLLRQMSELPEQVVRYNYETSPLKVKLDRAQMALLEGRTHYADDNPKIKLLEREVQELQKMIEDESKNQTGYKVFEANPMKEKLRAEIQTMQSRLRVVQRLRDDVQNQLDSTKKELATVPQKQAEFARLNYKKQMTQDLVRSSEQTIKMIELLMAAGQGDLELYQVAEKAEPAHSYLLMLLPLFGLLLGASMGYGALFVIEITDHKIRTRKQVEVLYNVPCLVVIPEIQSVNLHDVEFELSPLKTYVSRLADRIGYYSGHKKLHSLAITSSSEGEGKTVLCEHLAQYYEKLGLRTLIISFENAPSEHSLECVVSLNDFIANPKIVKDLEKGSRSIAHLSITCDVNSHKLLRSEELKTLLSGLEKTFHMVIFDVPNLCDNDIAEYVTGFAEATIFVIGSNVVPKSVADAGMLHFELYGIRPLGIVLSRVNPTYLDKISI